MLDAMLINTETNCILCVLLLSVRCRKLYWRRC